MSFRQKIIKVLQQLAGKDLPNSIIDEEEKELEEKTQK